MFNSPILKGKTAIITGGGSGLGKSMATYFNQLGANVVIISRSQDKLDRAVEEIQKLNPDGGQLLAISGDALCL